MTDTPLESLPDWSEDLIARAKNAWITTAEQVVAVSATPRGIRSLAEQLDVPEDEARRLVDSGRGALSSAKRAQMEEVVDTSEYGLGALRPEDEEHE